MKKALLTFIAIVSAVFAVSANSSTFYSKVSVSVASGEGKVYVSKDASVDDSLITETEHSTEQSSKGAGQNASYADQTYYLHAKADEGYGFKKWSDESTVNPHEITVRAESTTSDDPTLKTFSAIFEPTCLNVKSSNTALGIVSIDKSINAVNDVVTLTAEYVKQSIGSNEFGASHAGRLVRRVQGQMQY